MFSEKYGELLKEASKNARDFGISISEALSAISAFSKSDDKYKLEDVGGLLITSIIELQALQLKVRDVDDENRTIGVALNEIEHKLHIVSNLLENKE